MIDKGLIEIKSEGGSVVVTKKKEINKEKKYYKEKPNFVISCLNISELPIHYNLPMVCKPLDWHYKGDHSSPLILNNLSGGYLWEPTGDYYEKHRLMSSTDSNHFYIEFDQGNSDSNNYKKICKVMNKLQNQAYVINSPFLKYIKENEDEFVEKGLLVSGADGIESESTDA